MSKTKVLFFCTGNSARSQMAEAFLRKYAGDQFDSHSAGLAPSQINPFTKKVMAEIGEDLDGQYSKSVDAYLGKSHFGYLITVCDHADQNCPTTFLGVSNREHWSFEDPAAFEGTDEEKTRKFREIRDQIDQKIKSWVVNKA
jgi:arsenate reductase